MLNIEEFNKLLKEYKNEFEDILLDYNINKITNNEVIYKNKDNDVIVVTIEGNIVNFSKEKENLIEKVKMHLPKENNIRKPVLVLTTKKEKREHGMIVEYLEKIYSETIYSREQRYLDHLISERCVLENDKIDTEIDFFDINEVRKKSSLVTSFETHMIKYINGFRTTAHSNKTYLNGEDISEIYDVIEGPDKLNRIYDLYNGTINKRNINDINAIHHNLLSFQAFDCRMHFKITATEDELIGKTSIVKSSSSNKLINELIKERIGYKKEFDNEDNLSILDALSSSVNRAKLYLEKVFGMPYEEFESLDFDEQQELIKSIKKKQKKKDDMVTVLVGSGKHSFFRKVKRGTKVMIGSGENAIFVKAGVTPDVKKRKRKK